MHLKKIYVLPVFLLVLLVLLSAGEAMAASVTAPDSLSINVDWNSSKASSAQTIDYTNTTATPMSLTADIKNADLPGTYVSGLDVNIKGGGQSSYVTLATGGTDASEGGVATLKSSIANTSDSSSIDVYVELDANSVGVGASHLDTGVGYTITFTIS